MAHTREYVEQLRQHTDTCRDIVQELEGSEHAVLNAAKDFDTKVAAMRKAIEKVSNKHKTKSMCDGWARYSMTGAM